MDDGHGQCPGKSKGDYSEIEQWTVTLLPLELKKIIIRHAHMKKQ